jgi:two-component system, NtrC family, sensor kinase
MLYRFSRWICLSFMTMRKFISPLFLIITFTVFAQQNLIDSLTIKLQNHEPTDNARVRIMNELGYIYRSTNPDSSLAIANRALDLATKLNIPYERAWALNGISSAYWMKANYAEVLRFAHASLAIFEEINNLDGIGQSYNTLANTYNMQGEHEESLEYYKKSIEIYEKLGDAFNVARANANIGRTYYMTNRYPEALDYLQLVIDEYKDKSENILYPIALNTSGDVYQAQGRLNEALSFYEEALKISEAQNIPRIITYSTRGISEIYQKLEKLDLSNEYAIRTLEISKEIGYLENVKNAALIISNNSKQQGNFNKAYDYYVKFTAAKDSMFNKEKEQEITKLKENHEIGQQQKEIQLLQSERALQKIDSENQRIFIYSIVVITLLVMILGVFQYRKSQLKQKINVRLSKLNNEINSQKDHLEETLETLNETKEQLEKALETRNKFSSIISHDLRGLASQFSGASYLLGESLKNRNHEEMEKLVELTQDSSDKMTRLLDNLLTWSLQKNNYFPYAPEMVNIESQIREIVDLFDTQLGAKKINIIKDISPDHFIYVDKNSVMTIFRNLLSNAIKFTPESKSITINSSVSDGQMIINFTDEGVGIAQEKLNDLFGVKEGKSTHGTAGEKGVGLGLHLVNEFVNLNKGKIEVESEENKGSSFKVSFPMAD